MTTHVYSRTVDLLATPEVVFWDLLEPSHVAEYDSRFRTWIPREWPPQVGTRVDFVAKAFGVWSKGTSEVVAFDPPHRLGLVLVSPRTPLRSRLGWKLVGHDAETTFEYRFEIEAPPGLGWAARLLLRVFTSHLDTELPALASRYR